MTPPLARLHRPASSTRIRRDRARIADRSKGGRATGLFIICAVAAAFWVRRLQAVATWWAPIDIVVGLVFAVLVGLVVSSGLDLTDSTNELTRRLRLERDVSRLMRHTGAVVLDDRALGDGPPISHVVVTAGRVWVVVDASAARWTPWRHSTSHGTATAALWQAWIDASGSAAALAGRLPSADIRAAVVTDVRSLPVWAQRKPIFSIDDVPTAFFAHLSPPSGSARSSVRDEAERIGQLTSSAAEAVVGPSQKG